MEQNIGKANGKESKIPIFPTTEGGRQKSRIARAYIPKSREDWNNERMECEVSNKQMPFNDATSEYWHNMLGQKVCIGGIKKGILRYYGRTQFASGIWCGVELDEPVGKNDGTVDGVRYFSCEQNYGIFAPVSKVEKMALGDATEISNMKSRLPAPKITAKELISRISGSQQVKTPEDILCEKQDENRMSHFLCYGKRSKVSCSPSEDSNINKLTSNNSETVFDASDSSEFTSDESPEHLAKRSRLSTEEKSRDLDSTFTLQEPFLKPATSSSSLQESINGNDINSTFTISSPVLTECDKIESLPSDSDSLDEKTLSFSDLLSKRDGTFIVDSSSATLLERYSSCEDDQISLDLDESLGILTPNQMKDFTICLDTQNSEVIDLEMLNIPNSESCDDINEIPEYEEIQGITVEYTPDRNTGVQVSLLKTSSNEDRAAAASLEECFKTPMRTFHKYVDSAPSRLLDKEMEKLIASIDNVPHSEMLMNKKSTLDYELSSGELNNKHHSKANVIPTENNDLISNEYLSKKDKIENHIFLGKSITEARNECLTGSCFDVLKGEIRSESCIELEESADSDLKDNRPISMHTLESTDTGYQEDAGFDNHSEHGDVCEGVNRFSLGSHENCIVLDETEVKNNNRHKVTDSGIVLSGEGDEMFRSNDREAPLSISDAVQTELSNIHQQQEVDTSQKKLPVKKVDVTEFNKLDRWPMEASDEGCHMFEKTISSSLETTETYLLNEQNSGVNIQADGNCDLPAVKEANEVNMDSPTVSCCTTVPISSSSNFIHEKPGNVAPVNEEGTPKRERTRKEQEKSEDIHNDKSHSKTPKKNVISKIKAMIEATTSKTKVKADQGEHAKKPVKKGRWDAVTSKIAAGLAEEKSKPKAKKEIKSRIDTNLNGVRQMSAKRNLGADIKANSSFGTDNASESSLTMRNALDHQSMQWCHIRWGIGAWLKRKQTKRSVCSVAESTGKNSAEGSQTKERRQIVNISGAPNLQNKNSHALSSLVGASHRSSSPTLHSDSSTVSDSSKRVTVKQNFQGSNSTLASSPSNTAKKSVTPSTARKLTSVNTLQQKKLPFRAKPKISQLPSVGKYGGETQIQAPPVWSTRVELQQEIQRLGTLCEARTKELNHMKMNFRHASLGFDAFVVLFQYLTDELDVFSQPRLVLELEKTRAALEEAEAHLHQYQKEFEEMKAKHSEELCKLEKELNQSHQETIENLNLNHNAEIEELRQCHDKQLAELAETHKKQCLEIEEKHSAALLELKNEHSLQIEELKIFHADQIEAIENSHHETRVELNNQLKELEQQCQDLKHQAKLVEEALQRDTDTKIQWITAKKADLEKEVDSLKAVLDMRRNEIHTLRKENLEMKKELEKLPIAKEKIKMLEAKAEDLQALVNEKIQIERQLSTDHQNLKESYEKESKVNTRLSMENEELMWKLKQNYEANLLLNSFAGMSETAEKSLSPLKSPARQSVSLPMFFHSMETPPDTDKISLPVSSSNVTPCKKLPPLVRKCSSPIRTPSFVGASPPGPCSRKCKMDLKAVISPRKQKHKSHSSEKKFLSKEASASGHHPSEMELLQHSQLQSDENCDCAKDSSPSSINGNSSDGSQPDCLGDMDHNSMLFNDPLSRSNGSYNDEICSEEVEYSDESLNFEHYDMLITNQLLSKKYEELTHLKKGTEGMHEFDDSQHDSFISCSNSDNHSPANSQLMVTATEETTSSKAFTFDEQHFAETEPQEKLSHHSDHSFHKKSESWTISSFCSHTREPVANILSHSGCDNSLQPHLQPESSSVSAEIHSQTTEPSRSQSCSHPLQSTHSQEKQLFSKK